MAEVFIKSNSEACVTEGRDCSIDPAMSLKDNRAETVEADDGLRFSLHRLVTG